ncbi:MAG: hybrid sensor histidine kinase/response regulator [Leptothrix sp. (in: Bacteria)]|nr:hybrid sensor histidine kinase/response regulator [Leptothrix sp. (in: b-proteobacteria)]
MPPVDPARRVPLQRRLFLLALGAILPLAVASGIGLQALVNQQRLQAERASIDLARALSIAVGGELRLSISALETLATTPGLGPQLDAPHFEAVAREVLKTRPEWLQIMLARPNGAVVALGKPQPSPEVLSQLKTAEPHSFQWVVDNRRPVVGYLAKGYGGRWGVPVRVPVMRDGQLIFVLTAVLQPEALKILVERQQVPPNWLVSVWDAQTKRVARSRAHEKFLGSPPSPTLKVLFAKGGAEGIGPTHTLESEDVYTAFTRQRDFGWTVSVAVPASEMVVGATQSLLAYGGGVVLSVVIGLLAALAMARRINGPMGQLREAAQALGMGQAVQVPQGDISEIQEVGDALFDAACQRAHSEAERERLLAAERVAHAEAQSAMLQAQTANQAKDEFLAMLGHELRNPLSPIVTALHLMSRRDAHAHEFERRIIERQVKHMVRLVDDLLDVSRITQGKIELRREAVDLKAVVDQAVELTKPLLDSRSRPVQFNLPERPVMVWGDWIRLVQVVGNLLSNAAKFTPPDGLIEVSLSQGLGGVELSVRDEGNGIAPELLPQVFDLFTQGKQAIHRGSGGLGLGLAIVKTMVQLHGGRVSVVSPGPGLGSTFTINLLPLDAIVAWAQVDDVRDPTLQGQERILVVDDNQDAAETVALVLRDVGYEVRTAHDGLAALAVLDEFVPELAMLDIGLPSMDGYELASRLQADERTRHIPLIAVTGYGAESDLARALQAGFRERLVKPVETPQLLQTIRRLLSAAKSA